MARKIHLRRNKMISTTEARPVCATNPYREGSRFNSRSTYRYMASEVVGYEDFKNVPAEQRCAHCVDMGLVIRNRQRKAKGLAPVANLFD